MRTLCVRPAIGWAIVALGILAACQEEDPIVTLPAAEAFLGADHVFMSGTHTITNPAGIRMARLQFDTMYTWNDSTHFELRGVTLVVNAEDGTERGTVTSKEGTYVPETGRLTARVDVVLVVPGQDRRLETSELHFDPDGEQLWSDSAFVMTVGPDMRSGRSFRTDAEFQNFEVRELGGGGG